MDLEKKNEEEINKKKTDNFNIVSFVILIIFLIVYTIFISDKAGENIMADILKIVLLTISFFLTKFTIRFEILKYHKRLGIVHKIFYIIAIIFLSAFCSWALSNKGEDLGTDYDLFYEYFIIIFLSSLAGAYSSFNIDYKISEKQRFEELKKFKDMQ